MKIFHKNYLIELLGFSNSNDTNQSKNLENEFRLQFNQFILEKEGTKSISLTISICLPMIFLILSTIYTNQKPIRSTYSFSIGIIIEIVLSIFTKKYDKSFTKVQFLRYLRFFLFYLNISLNWIFPSNPINDNILRYAYCLVFYVNFINNFFLHFNYPMLILITFLNTTVLLAVQYSRELGNIYLLPEIIINTIYNYIFSLIKKSESQSQTESFIELYKNNNYIVYTQNLVNVLNTVIISIRNDDILFYNDYTINYFSKNKYHKITSTFRVASKASLQNEENLMNFNNEYENSDINSQINNFLSCLFLKSNSSIENIKLDNNFKTIIERFSSENDYNTVNFIKLGYFSHSKVEDSYFEIHARKLKYQNEAIELLIYDISEIKKAEKQAIETKYKHKILAKIAHEFKTPLISIISLSDKIVKDKDLLNLDVKTQKNLYYINNLSNYTLSLISDIIHYASDYLNLRITKNEINLHEVMDFSNNVLKTLVECNENKSSKIETKLIIDKALDNIKIYTDENRLKQILLNFISNAFKFTQQGYIKLKAKYLNELNQIEISVKDTGIGIKEEDHDLIFKENVQLNVDNEYNKQGSGLGLSIVKNIANFLNYKLGFKSTYDKGSKFFIRIICKNTKKEFKFKTTSYNNQNILLTNNKKSVLIANTFSNNGFDNNLENINIYQSEISDIISLCPNKSNELDINETKNINFDLIKYRESLEGSNIYSEKEITCFNFMLGNLKHNYNSVNKLVIVDDYKYVRENTVNLIKIVLKNINSSLYQIVECSDGIELLNQIRLDTGNQIKLILTDENMEYLNGSDSVRIIRKLQENKRIKNYNIVSITAFDDQETKNKIMGSGVNSILTKPCNKSDLTKILTNFFIPYINT